MQSVCWGGGLSERVVGGNETQSQQNKRRERKRQITRETHRVLLKTQSMQARGNREIKRKNWFEMQKEHLSDEEKERQCADG